MKKFESAELVEQVIYDMRLADLPRGGNRAKMDSQANGDPPWSKKEVEDNKVSTNVNWLEYPELLADARRSWGNAFFGPGRFFNVALDSGPISKRDDWSRTITSKINKALKNRKYFETLNSQIALTVMHGIGPVMWRDKDRWCPVAKGIEDVLIPGGTYLDMENLSYFGVYDEFTAEQFYGMTHGPKVDPAWQMPVVEAALTWINEQTREQLPYNDLFAPEKVQDRIKEDMGFYGTDAVPTLKCWSFYFHSSEGGKEGWRKRMVLDTPIPPGVTDMKSMPKQTYTDQEHGHWLYKPAGDRVYADSLDQIIHFQFGDASAKAPFKYHTVRSLGWLLYSVCRVQNRLRCRMNDAIFEALLQYFQCSNPEDRDRISKIDLHHLGLIPDGVRMIPQAERWQPNMPLVELGLGQNQERMVKAAAQYREARDEGPKTEKTATQVMSEVNAANALVGAMLLRAYTYAEYQDTEIARRFCIQNSADPDVRKFRLGCLKAGIPAEMLDVERWSISHERTLGSGNKMLQIAMADKLMGIRPLLNPQAQQEVSHLFVAANSDNPDLATKLVPLEGNEISDTSHDADVALGTLMEGLPVRPKKTENQIEVIESWLNGLAMKLKQVQATGLPTPKEIAGLMNVAGAINQRMQQLAQDKNEQGRVKQYGKALAEMVKEIQGFQKAVQEAQQQGNGHMDPAEIAKAQATMMQAKGKMQIAQQSHAQKTQQRQQQFAQKQTQDAQRHQVEMATTINRARVDTAAKDLTTAAEIRRGKLKGTKEKGE